MTAWWFTLGGGIGCLIMAIIYIKPLRKQSSPTLVGMVRDEYGKSVGMAATILNSVGTFINILSQLIAASAVVLVVFPNLGSVWTIILSAVFMVLYVVFGGTKGAGIVGMLKLGLLYVTMVVCGVIVLKFCGGVGAFTSMVNGLQIQTSDGGVRNLWSLFGRGFWTDFGSCMSLILGVLTTQTYAQAVINAKTDKDARIGALISTILIPIIGVFGIMVGLYMRSVADPAELAANSAVLAKTALTSFILDYSGIPRLLGGIMLGALFIASVGTGAGLALGISTVVNRDLINKGQAPADAKKFDSQNKLIIIVVLAIATVLTCVLPADTIQDYAFLSMALRGCTVFAPLCFLIWAKGKVSSSWAMLSVVCGSVVALVYGVLKLYNVITFPLAAVFPGIAVGLVLMILGFAFSKKQPQLKR
jgi:SSS family solute:Na+ symporter